MKKTTILLVVLLISISAGALAYRSIDQRLIQANQELAKANQRFAQAEKRLAEADDRLAKAEAGITSLRKFQRDEVLNQARMYIEERLHELNKPTAAERAAERVKFEAEVLEHIARIKAEQ